MNLAAIRSYRHDPIEQTYTERDTILYALGLGCGTSLPMESELRFLYGSGLRALPSMCVVLGKPNSWLEDPALGVDYVKVVHGEQRFTLHRPLANHGSIRAETEVLGVEDKGASRGAILFERRHLIDTIDGAKLATLHSSVFMRGGGGRGGFGETVAPAGPIPDRTPDEAIDITTTSNLALIYRLSGDMNPLHADPEIARAAGFERPILHGLCTMGIACRALLATYCDGDPDRLRDVSVRFTAPVFPGETLRTECFRDGGVVRFRTRVPGRDVVALDRGRAEIS